MLKRQKISPAIKATQTLVIQARFMDGLTGQDELAKLLDEIEYLPQLILSGADEASTFEIALKGISDQHPSCRKAYEEFTNSK
ncbi:hypothetical protein Pla110_06250 [Polystyrenella longa]|uniref:Uncharacterized protein n=1 Tax=Polystyrenella longa TaxID=2528007 RepID=A0A518CI73_9PLAN|nr:hypothetical protein [Polystyrenella longa]QDU78921.1 hypothetical protein Pla110_06250 [Polystyrenella longa]